MKTIVVVLAIFLVGALGQLTDEQKAKLREHKTACIAETGADLENVKHAVENIKNGGSIEDSDGKLACFSYCLLKRIGILNEDDSVNVDVIRAKAPQNVPQDKLETVIAKCQDLPGTGCEKGGNIMKCILETKTFNILS